MSNLETVVETTKRRGGKKLSGQLQTERNWDTDEAAAYLKCEPTTLRTWVSQRKVPFVKIGRLTRFRKRDLDAWMDQNAVSA